MPLLTTHSRNALQHLEGYYFGAFWECKQVPFSGPVITFDKKIEGDRKTYMKDVAAMVNE